MHVILENARKAAGISSMKKNYPDDPKQRGCGFWAAVWGSIGNDIAKLDQELSKALKEKAQLATEKADLEHDLNKLRALQTKEALTAVGFEKGWSADDRQQIQKRMIAG